MRKLMVCAAGVLLYSVVLAAPQSVLAEGAKNSVNFLGGAGGGGDSTGSIVAAEYERLLNRTLAVLVRLHSFSYETDNNTWHEKSTGDFGVDFGARAYLFGKGFKGFYLGGNVGFGDVKADWVDKTQPTGSPFRTGTLSTSYGKIEFDLGGRFPLGTETVSLSPSFHLGSYVGDNSTCTYSNGTSCTKSSSIGPYAFFGLTLGVAF